MRPRPIPFVWDGRSMVPLDRSRPLCDRQFRLGQEYSLIPHEPRSHATHAHFFAAVSDGWNNLREDDAKRFPSSEHLRRWALIKAGYADEHSIVCESERKARNMGALCRTLDEYAVITVRGNVLRVYTAQSQSHHAMDRETFQASKQAVLEIIAAMIQVTPKKLAENAGRSA